MSKNSGNYLQHGAQGIQLAGAAQFFILAGNELGVFGHEDLAHRAQIEAFGVIPEILAVHARPYQAAIGIDVDLGHAQFGGALELGIIHTLGALQLAAGGIDAGDLILRHRAGAVHDQRETRQALLDLGQHVKAQALGAAEFKGAMAGADGAGQ